MDQLPEGITFCITEDDVKKASELVSRTASVCSSCVVAVAINRWLERCGIRAKAHVGIGDIEIWRYDGRSATYEHSTKSREAMDAFDSKQPVELCTTTIRRKYD